MNSYSDIALSELFQLQASASGDLLISTDARMQDICMEAITPTGGLFYDLDYGWGLVDFAQRTLDDLLLLEISQRVRLKLSTREEVEPSSIVVLANPIESNIMVRIEFRFVGEDELRQLGLQVTPLEIEVITID